MKLELMVGNMVGVQAVGGGTVALVALVYHSKVEEDCGWMPTQTNHPLKRPEQSFPTKGFHSKLGYQHTVYYFIKTNDENRTYNC